MMRLFGMLVLFGHCIEGWLDSSCPVGYYGQNCSLPCGHCGGDGTCVRTNGICFDGCLPEYTGPDCRDDCPPNCGGDQSCSATTQFCTDGCKPGFDGFFCNETSNATVTFGIAECSNCVSPCKSYGCPNGCVNGFFGYICDRRCDCPEGTPCKQFTGTCLTPGDDTTTHNWTTHYSTTMTSSREGEHSIFTKNIEYLWMIIVITALVIIIIIIIIVVTWFCHRKHKKQISSSYEGPVFQPAADTRQSYARPSEPEQNSYLELIDESFTYDDAYIKESEDPHYYNIEDLPRFLPTESTDTYLNESFVPTPEVT
ncbi:uncharacterized protein LOC111116000 isoform X2 [Crassostrea virginica]